MTTTIAGRPQRSLSNLLLDLSIGDSQIELETFTDALNLILFAKRRMTSVVNFKASDVLTAINTYRQLEAAYGAKEKTDEEHRT